MKALSFSRLTLVIGLALGLMVVWVATATATLNEDPGFGASVIITGGDGTDGTDCPCDGTTAGQLCSQVDCCSSTVTTCDYSGFGSGHCSGASNDPCIHKAEDECPEDAICS